ncbi:hypothetical protein Droror1_Dr00020541 [Drosera rotundifolia]
MDLNSKYFHSLLKVKRRKRNILSLVFEHRVIIYDENGVSKEIQGFKQKLLGVEPPFHKAPLPAAISLWPAAHHRRSSPLPRFTSSSWPAKFPRVGASLNGTSRSVAARYRWTSPTSPLSSGSLSSAGSGLDGVSNQPDSSSRGSSLTARLGQP